MINVSFHSIINKAKFFMNSFFNGIYHANIFLFNFKITDKTFLQNIESPKERKLALTVLTKIIKKRSKITPDIIFVLNELLDCLLTPDKKYRTLLTVQQLRVYRNNKGVNIISDSIALYLRDNNIF